MSEWELLPAHKHAKENKPAVYLVNRLGRSAELKANLSILPYVGEALYVEIMVNQARNQIKLVPKKKQTAYSRSVTCDLKTYVRIGGGQLLRQHFNMPFGKYTMTEDLVFKKV